MSEEKISEFIRELAERTDPLPKDLIKKYRDQGVSEGEIAAALLARTALAGPDAPESALEKSQRRVAEMAAQSAAKPSTRGANTGLGAKIRNAMRSALRKKP